MLKQWYVYHVGDDELALKTLTRRVNGTIEMWIPLMRVRKLVDGKWCETKEDVLPGYVLFASEHGKVYIEQTLRIELLRSEPLSDDEVKRLRELEDIELYCDLPFPSFGQKVNIKRTARTSYSGLSGIFRRTIYVNGGRVAEVEIDLYGERTTMVHVPFDHLDLVS